MVTAFFAGGNFNCRQQGILIVADQYTRKSDDPGATIYAEPSPDYFQYVDLGGKGLTPVGYGYRSVEHIIQACLGVESETGGLAGRQSMLREIDATGLVATPANSSYNELVIEAARESILHGGKTVTIEHSPALDFGGVQSER